LTDHQVRMMFSSSAPLSGSRLGCLGRRIGFTALIAAVALLGTGTGRALMPPAVHTIEIFVGDDRTTAAVLVRGHTLGALGSDAFLVRDCTTGRPVRYHCDLLCDSIGPGAGKRNPPPGSVQQLCRLWLSLRNLAPDHTYEVHLQIDREPFIRLPLKSGVLYSDSANIVPPGSGPSLTPVESNGRWGYQDAEAVMRIAPRYVVALPFNAYGLAVAVDPDTGWAYIDRQGRVVIQPNVVDNGPDPFVEGLARFRKKGKMGFFNPRGQVVIEPGVDFARPFCEGRAAVCRGCRLVPEGEYTVVRGGQWGFLDPFGREVVPLHLEHVGDYKNGRARVRCKGQWQILDRQGNRITDP